MMGPSDDPPEPPEPCPVCGACPPEVEAKRVFEGPCGGVEGDLVCADCGCLLEQGALLSEPDFI